MAFAPCGGLRAADEPEIAWDQIVTWATPPAAPDPGAGETEKKPEAVAAVKTPEWTPSRPGERRPLPPMCKEIETQLEKRLVERIRELEKTKDLKGLYEVFALYGKYDRAAQYLLAMLQDTRDKRWKDEQYDGWIEQKMWESAMSNPQKPSINIDGPYQEWLRKAQKYHNDKEADPNWVHWHKKERMKWFAERQEYYSKDSKTIWETVRDLDIRGDGDADALWSLAERFDDSRPSAPLREVITLYKMREWYPNHAKVSGGHLQWRLCHRLTDRLGLHKEAAEEAQTMLEKFPGFWACKNGEAKWHLGHCLYRWGDALTDKDEQIPLWKKAREVFVDIQKNHADFWVNNTGPMQPVSECSQRIASMNERINKAESAGAKKKGN